MSPAADPARDQRVVAVFSALGDPTRLGLVEELLQRQPLSISNLASRSSVSRQAVTKHLRVLEAAGLVVRNRQGRESRYRLAPGAIEAARRYLDRASAQWDDAVDRLKQHLRDSSPQ